MSKQPHVGLSLVNKAPLGILFTALIFFILVVSLPLVLVLFTPLDTATALINLVSGYFLGFCVALTIYKFLPAKSIEQ